MAFAPLGRGRCRAELTGPPSVERWAGRPRLVVRARLTGPAGPVLTLEEMRDQARDRGRRVTGRVTGRVTAGAA